MTMQRKGNDASTTRVTHGNIAAKSSTMRGGTLVRQRLTETSAELGQPLDVHGRRLIDCYDQLAGILRNRLGQNHAHFLAQPVERSGSISWFTQLAGEVVGEDALIPEERQRLKDRASQILGDIEGLAADIRTEGATGPMLGEMLRAAAQLAPGASLFSVGGKPVITLWGHRSASSNEPARRTMPNGVPQVNTVAIAAHSAPSGGATATQPAVSGGRARPAIAGIQARTWIIPALIGLSVLIVLLWGMRSCSTARVEPDAPDLTAQIAEVEARNKALEVEIAQRKSNAPRVKCVPEPTPSAPKAARDPAAMKEGVAAASQG
jgi:hypothetical protein